MKDAYGDQVYVLLQEGFEGVVYLGVADSTQAMTRPAEAELTPAKARKLARRLVKAADKAEAK